MFVSTAVTALVAALAVAPEVSAGGLSLAIGVNTNWGSPNFGAAPASVKTQCRGAGSFIMDLLGQPGCVSPQTIGNPPGNNCPFNWGWHGGRGCCVPKKEVYGCDCGEGFTFNRGSLKCVPNRSPGCGPNQWFHQRSGGCCDNGWQHNPPRGNCPPGVYCPTGWFWHSGLLQCRPTFPRCGEPDCGPDWIPGRQCCCRGGNCGPGPSQKAGGGGSGPKPPGRGHGGGGGRHPWGWKRDQEALGENDVDSSIYCPNDMTACTVPTESGAWAWECLDTQTELESCGGCIATGAGKDCTSIANAVSVGCEQGACIVHSCKSGFAAVNGTSCERV
ncbi:hypothetical protein Q8F55_003868 [Vanrija albida]|uniref:Protein CPL1-like domain-containing protein n=1 Tax=Vanrija albida TaxID=181172 RepID=A0ABR3Q553_9TREE